MAWLVYTFVLDVAYWKDGKIVRYGHEARKWTATKSNRYWKSNQTEEAILCAKGLLSEYDKVTCCLRHYCDSPDQDTILQVFSVEGKTVTFPIH